MRKKVAKPPQFDGDREKFRVWWTAVRLYLHVMASDFPTDEDKVACVLSYMQEGQAGQWATIHTEEYLDVGFPTYRGFSIYIETEFASVLKEEKARTKLDTMTQGNRTVDEYNIEARQWYLDANI